MAWPALTVPVPTVTDSFRSYAIGSVLGADAGLDRWSVHPTGMRIVTGGWMSIKEIDGSQDAVGGPPFSVAKWIGSAIGVHHWSAIQSIGALDWWKCGGNAVRCDPSTDSGYLLFELCAPHVVQLVRRVAGVDTILATWFPDAADGGPLWPGGYAIDGYQDDHLWVLEVVGTNPVELRASVWLNRLHEVNAFAPIVGGLGNAPVSDPADALMVVPGDVWDYGHGPAGIVIGTFTDSSPSRLTTGGPGVAWVGAPNDAGGIFGFSTGEIQIPGVHSLRAVAWAAGVASLPVVAAITAQAIFGALAICPSAGSAALAPGAVEAASVASPSSASASTIPGASLAATGLAPSREAADFAVGAGSQHVLRAVAYMGGRASLPVFAAVTVTTGAQAFLAATSAAPSTGSSSVAAGSRVSASGLSTSSGSSAPTTTPLGFGGAIGMSEALGSAGVSVGVAAAATGVAPSPSSAAPAPGIAEAAAGIASSIAAAFVSVAAGPSVRIVLYDRSPRMLLYNRTPQCVLYDRSPRMTLYERSDD